MRHVDHAQIRPYTDTDEAGVRELNADNVPAVGELDDHRLALFRDDPRITFDVVDLEGSIVGLFVGVPPDVQYGSDNYLWFAARHARFAYVDRIALAPITRGTGLADELYDRWEQAAAHAGATVVCAEVNTVPRNERSLAFHARRGFQTVAENAPYGGDERVAMLELPLRDARAL